MNLQEAFDSNAPAVTAELDASELGKTIFGWLGMTQIPLQFGSYSCSRDAMYVLHLFARFRSFNILRNVCLRQMMRCMWW